MDSVKPWATTTNAIPGGPLLPGQITSFVHFQVSDGEAMVVKVPNIDATYTGAQIANAWTGTSAYATVTGSLNNTQAFHDSDGYTYYVLSDQNPGVANWINTSGLQDGLLALRIQGLNGDIPANAQILGTVPVGEVGTLLPSDYPTVSAAEYAAEIQQRIFQYDYAMDQTHNPIGWVTTNLEFDQIKAAVGDEQFEKIFGGQQDVPSVLDRMTDATWMPNLGSVINAFMADPSGATAALVENLPLALKDIELPMVLAALRLEMGLPDAFTQMWTDPATSITAGFLNARDDLATSILNSDGHPALTAGDFTSVSDQMTELYQAAQQMLSAGMSYLFDGGVA